VVTLPDFMADTALARLFAQEHREGDAAWFSLPGGATLYAPGEAADYLYFLRTGRLGAFRREEGQEPQFLGVIRPGEPAGEMAMIAGTPTRPTWWPCAIRKSWPCPAPPSSRRSSAIRT
jgi:NTE family protein